MGLATDALGPTRRDNNFDKPTLSKNRYFLNTTPTTTTRNDREDATPASSLLLPATVVREVHL